MVPGDGEDAYWVWVGLEEVCRTVVQDEVVPVACSKVAQLAQHQVGITGDKTAAEMTDHCNLEDAEVVQMAALVEEHIEAVLHWGEGGVVVDHGADDIGELVVPGDQVGEGMDKVEIS